MFNILESLAKKIKTKINDKKILATEGAYLSSCACQGYCGSGCSGAYCANGCDGGCSSTVYNK